MDRERWRRVDRLFEAVRELPVAEREQLLERRCGDDATLRAEVVSLLEHDRDDGFLEEGAAVEAARLMAHRQAEELVGRRIDRFEVEAHIGSGGMGEVYRARDPRLDRTVAVKLIPAHLRDDPERRLRFRREALAASALNHPNIVTVYEVAEHGGFDLLVTELVEGESVRDLVGRGPLPFELALDVACQVARGLSAAHAAGIVHRDIKPENLMLRDDGLVKILDFGIAEELGRAEGVSGGATEGSGGAPVGTVAYMSPEQAGGERVDARTDVWSLGAVLYEMLTGSRPFGRPAARGRLAVERREAPEPPSKRRREVPTAVDRVVARAMAPSRSDRYPDGAGFARALEVLRGRLRTDRRRRTALGSLLVLALACGPILWRITAGAPASFDSIAVLPLEAGEGEELEWMGDGLTESLIQGLSRSDGLRVVSSAAAFRYKGREEIAPREVGAELGVDSLLTGRLQKRGERLAVTVELVDAADEAHLWGDRYELDSSELPGLFESIVAEVLTHLHRRTSDRERQLIGRLHTDDLEAYRTYLEGRYYWRKSAPADYRRSRDLFERALTIDPDYALAWVGLGHYHGFGAATGTSDPEKAWPEAERAFRRALELDPTLPELDTLRAALTLYWRREWVEGARQLARAVEEFPEGAVHCALALGLLGRFEEAERCRSLALVLEPSSPRTHRSLGVAESLRGHTAEAVGFFERAIELDPTDIPSWQGLGDALARLGRSEDAVAAWSRELELAGRPDQAREIAVVFRDGGLSTALRASGLSRLERLAALLERGEFVPAFSLARENLRAGRREEGIRWVEKAFGEHNRLVLDLLHDPVFDSIRDDSVYRSGVEGLGLSGPSRVGG